MIILPHKALLMDPASWQRWLFTSKNHQPKPLLEANHETNGMATIPVHGVLTKRAGLLDGVLGNTSYEQIYMQFASALDDDSVHTILFDMDSPGGETGGLFDLCDTIYNMRGVKPMYAVANDDCFSAAYAIASSCDKLYVSRTGGVGSIGVIAHHMDQSDYDAKQGVTYKTIYAGARKNDGNPHEAPTEASLQSLHSEVNRIYDMFVHLVARNRGLSTQAIRDTEAAVYFGEASIQQGLADELMTKRNIVQQIGNTQMTIEANQSEAWLLEGRKQYAKELQELVRLCKVAKMPEKVSDCIEQTMSLEEAREHLMAVLAERSKPEIMSTITPEGPSVNAMIEAAKQRGAQ